MAPPERTLGPNSAEIVYSNERFQEYSKRVFGPLAFFIQQILDEQRGLNLVHPFRNLGTLQIEEGFEDVFTFFGSDLKGLNADFRSFFFEHVQNDEFLKKVTEYSIAGHLPTAERGLPGAPATNAKPHKPVRELQVRAERGGAKLRQVPVRN